MIVKVLFICYWGIEDSLTIATVLPRLKVLQQRQDIEQIVLVTIERETMNAHDATYLSSLNTIKHLPYHSGKRNGRLLEKAFDFVHIPEYLVKITREHNIDYIWAHSAPAGALAYKLWSKTKLPFYVSSFEPHSEYMAESGVWSRFGLKYLFQRYWEKKQKQLSAGLMPVAENYKEQLIREGVPPEKIFTVPCSVNATDFEYDSNIRESFRGKLNWDKAVTIGIYVGKFGDLYYDHEAFQIYNKCFELFPDFRLIILTPRPQERILQQLKEHNIDLNKVYINSVPHEQVPAYLSTADLAFATYKPGPSKKYLSPVKIGEYWANGLPVLLTEGVGDDSDIIKNEGGGALFNLQEEGSLELAIKKIQQILKDPAHRREIPKLALKYRSPDKIKEAYDYFFGNMEADR